MNKNRRRRLWYAAIFIGVAAATILAPSGMQTQASGTVPLQNYFTVDSGGDQGKKMPLYDGTIEKYNGYYYVAGTGTEGNLYRSKDMVHWEGPIHFAPDTLPPFAPNDNTFARYGASDFFFHNGVMFYGFNSNNLLHGNPSTMATDHPDFRNSFLDKQYDTGIDLQFFVAPNGDQLILRKVNPGDPDPNNLSGPALGRPGIWMWNVKSFFDELGNPDRGQAKELLHTSPGYWSNLNHFNFEGPELYYRNGQYYLLDASNQMDPRSGLYDTGVAQSDDYNTFDNSKKLPNKLLGRNIESLLLKYNTILPTSEFGSQAYTFTYNDPGEGWQNVNFDTTSWQTGNGGFGYPLYTVKPARVPSIYTTWGSPDTPENLWVRRTFNLTSVPDTVVLRHRLEGYGKLYINGVQVVDQEGNQPGYANVEVPKGILKPGANVIAATMSRTGPQKLANYHLDFGLYDTLGEPVEADIVGPSQPNIIEGPNGFETWITYKAFWNGVNGQGKDRVYFWGNEMVADGPTSSSSSGVHFDASAPSFEDRFDNESSWNNYESAPGDTSIQDGILSMNSKQETKQMLLRDRMPSNYDMESNIRFDDSTGLAGVTVWYQDDANQIRLLVDRDRKKYVIETIQNGQTTTQEADLPSTYRFVSDDPRAADFGEQFHPLKVYKNGTKLYAELDHYKLNNDQPVLDSALLQTPGKVGLVCQNSKCSIDNVTLTDGWTESGNQINQWGSPWTSGAQGLVSPASGQSLNVKGDALNEYEFSTNVTSDTLPSTGESGIIVEYKDANNYVAAFTNYATHQFELYKVENGQANLLQSTSTARDTIYGFSNYDEANYNLKCGTTTTPACDIGQLEYDYKLRAPAEISGAKILWTYGNFDYLKMTGSNMFDLPSVTSPNFGFDSWNKTAQSWSPVGGFTNDAGQRGVYQTFNFNSNQTSDQIRLRVPLKDNRPFSFAVHEEVSAQNFYRTVRKDGQLYVWVNNQLLFKQVDPFSGMPARVGLYTNDLAANFNSITAFEVKNPDGTTATGSTPGTTDTTTPPAGTDTSAPSAGVNPFRTNLVNEDALVKKIKDLMGAAKNTNVSFSDAINHWDSKDITLAVQLHIVDGYKDGTFHPDAPVTRAEFAAMVVRAFGLENGKASVSFKDTSSNWAFTYINTLASNGIVNGYADGSFKPDATISRAEMVSIFGRILNLSKLANGTPTSFKDVSGDYWAKDDIQRASAANLIQGETASTFAPNRGTTRAEALTVIIRALESDSSIKQLIQGMQ